MNRRGFIGGLVALAALPFVGRRRKPEPGTCIKCGRVDCEHLRFAGAYPFYFGCEHRIWMLEGMEVETLSGRVVSLPRGAEIGTVQMGTFQGVPIMGVERFGA